MVWSVGDSPFVLLIPTYVKPVCYTIIIIHSINNFGLSLHSTVQKSTVQDTASVAKKGHEIREQLKEGEFSAKIVKS